MKYCVYCHTNRIDGKKYIGITSQKPERRWNNGQGYKNNQYFYRAILKYGWHNFMHEILYTDLTKSEAEKYEIQLIAEYQTTFNAKGYNIEKGGNSTGRIADETIIKIKNALRGRSVSDETKRKISESKSGKPSPKKGCKMSAENIEKNRIAHLGQKPWNLGKRWNDVEKAKFGGKKVLCVELNKIYLTAHEASKELSIDFSSICKCRRGKAHTAGGYHWEDINE